MSRYPHPPEPGRRPAKDVLEAAPTCTLCSWAFRLKDGLFGLKVINDNCKPHKGLDRPPGPADPLLEWLLPAS